MIYVKQNIYAIIVMYITVYIILLHTIYYTLLDTVHVLQCLYCFFACVWKENKNDLKIKNELHMQLLPVGGTQSMFKLFNCLKQYAQGE